MLRHSALMGGLGGEEFAVLLPETDTTTALEVAERLRATVAALEVRVDDTADLPLTVSLGVALCPGEDVTVDHALNRADQALYRAKTGGRNRVEVDGIETRACKALV